jgi:hypothetical protein
MVAAFVLVVLIVLRVTLLTIGSVLLVRPVRSCPACFHSTAPVLHPWLERFTRLEWRWCAHCGWSGPARRVGRPPGQGPGYPESARDGADRGRDPVPRADLPPQRSPRGR